MTAFRFSFAACALVLTLSGCAAVDPAATGDDAEVVSGQCAFGDGDYCGGNGATGDPDTLYACANGTPSVLQHCPRGCSAQAAGTNDFCHATAEGESCSPERAKGAVGPFQKALHDTIAFAEGTRAHSRDGYDVMFSFKLVSTCSVHPDECLPFGDTCSTAAGRYQFLTTTWNGIAAIQGLETFEPEDQERAASYLVRTVRGATVPQDRPLGASELVNVITKLSFEWASLPPGQYGQPIKTHEELREVYCSVAGC